MILFTFLLFKSKVALANHVAVGKDTHVIGATSQRLVDRPYQRERRLLSSILDGLVVVAGRVEAHQGQRCCRDNPTEEGTGYGA